MRPTFAPVAFVRWIRAAIIGVLVCALAGCSALRLGYGNGSTLAWWWLDGYLDFASGQAPQVKAEIERWFEWHRATQLSEYVALLVSLQAQATQPLSPALACRWNDQIRSALEPALDRALVQGADLIPGLGEAQLRHLEQRYTKNLQDMRAEFVQADLVERRAASVKRTVDRVEQVYGALDEAQRQLIADGVAASPFDPQAWLEERQRRQRDTLATLRRLVSEQADRDTRIAALRALRERNEISPDPAYRAYQRRLVDYNCGFAARIHNVTTAAQRQRARATLAGWEQDLRSLAPPTAGAPRGAAAAPG